MTLQQLQYAVTVASAGTITEAAERLYITQPSLTTAIRELEKEMNLTIFIRSNRGVVVSKEGEVFLGYARQILEQTELLKEKYTNERQWGRNFCVSTQHYSFAVNAFVELIQKYAGEEYDFNLRETQTYEIIEDVALMKSELGILYLDDENKNVIKCKGDTIQLPKEAAGKKLYILATSTDKDRKAKFIVNSKSHEFEIPYYSGFYGQWGHKGVSDGYIRNASLAYIGSHRHTKKGNDTYIYTYMYKFGIELPKEAHTLVLPKDENIAVFAITLSDNYIDNISAANEMRTLPLEVSK